MASKNYLRGYHFERKTKKYLEERNWFTIRQGKSRFPDLIAIKVASENSCWVRLIECKNQSRPKTYYLSQEEKNEFKKIKNKWPSISCQVAYQVQDPKDKRKKIIKFDDLYENESYF